MAFGTRVHAQPTRPVAKEPAKKNVLWVIIPILIAVIAAVAGRVAGNEIYHFFSRPAPLQFEGMLSQVVEKTKPTLPRKIDKVTTMTAISYADKRMTYVYDLAFEGKQAPAALMSILHKMVVGRVCASDMKRAMQEGIGFAIRYNNPSGGKIGEFVVTAPDCA